MQSFSQHYQYEHFSGKIKNQSVDFFIHKTNTIHTRNEEAECCAYLFLDKKNPIQFESLYSATDIQFVHYNDGNDLKSYTIT